MDLSSITVPTEPAMTEQCSWLSQENRTGEPQLSSAECLFESLLPHGRAVQALICVVALLTVFSLLVNVLTLLGFKPSEDLSFESRFTLFKNLVLSDLVQTLTFGPSIIHSLVTRRTMAFGAWCKVQYLVGTVGIFSSLLTITCMALERYLYVCHALSYIATVTQRRLRAALLLVWLYSLSVALMHVGAERSSEQVTGGLLCEPDMVEQQLGFPRASAVSQRVAGAATLLVCVLVHAFCYRRMYRDARNAETPFKASGAAARDTVLFYLAMLVLQLLPLIFRLASDGHHLGLLVTILVPPCVNPLVYGLRSAEMRRTARDLRRRWTERSAAEERGVELGRIGIPSVTLGA